MHKGIPRVSIGLPVFNGEQFLPEAVDSLLRQTYSDFELVISDNGSTDCTETICRDYAAKDRRVRYYRGNQNRGSVWNFNRVFTLARAEYFKWAACDDICAPEYLGACVEALDSDVSVILCYSETILIDEKGKQLGRYIDRCTDAGSTVPHERFRDLIANLGLSNPMFGLIRAKALRRTPVIANYIGSDIVLLAELALLGRFYKIPNYLFFRRDHPQKSDRANRTLEELAVWYRPDNKGSIHQLRNSRLFLEYLACVRRQPLCFQQKARCYLHMAKWLKWELKEISSECTYALTQMATSRRENRA
ncbi:MAG: glycosyl transferase family 2 [Acidobacteria bacterium]|nr:MAG: glycosyl transferase family 2 [Acidobacteriota bacterium]PYS16447.1 MAG: glycosyl transferase family 2 [Acidobacteriota bacterium]